MKDLTQMRDGFISVRGAREHNLRNVDLELPRATTGTIVLHLREPASNGKPIVLRQPGVLPLAVSLSNAPCR